MVMPGNTRIGPRRPVHIYLREWRENRNLTQQQLADRLGVDKATISRWEGGKRSPSLNVLAALGEALNVPLPELNGPPPPPGGPAPPLAPAEIPQADIQAIAAEVARLLKRARR